MKYEKKFYCKFWMTLLIFAICALFTSVLIVANYSTISKDEASIVLILSSIVSVPFLMFGCLMSLGLLLRFVKRKPVVLIDDQGVTTFGINYALQRKIHWEEVSKAEIMHLETTTRGFTQSQALLTLTMKNPAEYAQKLNGLQKFFFNSNNSSSIKGTQSIPLRLVKAKTEDVLQAIKEASQGKIEIVDPNTQRTVGFSQQEVIDGLIDGVTGDSPEDNTPK